MIKKYAYNSKTQLTKNINVSELKCKGNKHTHNTLVDTTHINNVQDFMNRNGYTKILISRGYSCPKYNKKIGGASGSQHTKGKAIDCRFYKGSTPVSAKEVCCKAQDYGFKGIAYINANYVHLDNRTIGKYRGDETKGYSNNVGGDFYSYFGIKKEEAKYNLTRTLKKGSKGDDVKQLQKTLIELGYSVGKYGADGSFGNDTENAVKKFQKAKGITQDGLVGKNTAHKFGWTYKNK